MFWLGVVVGLVVGINVGVLLLAVLLAGAGSDTPAGREVE